MQALARLFSWRWLVIFLLTTGGLMPLWAQDAEPKVFAQTSTTTAVVGEEVELGVIVRGGSRDERPKIPEIEGADVGFIGRESRVFGSLTAVEKLVNYRYVLVIRREGEVKIPPIDVTVGGKNYQTQPLTIKVLPPENSAHAGDFAFARIQPARPSAYVGEDVPLDLTFYFDRSARWNIAGLENPKLEGDGFSSRQVTNGRESGVEMAGKKYSRLTFRTAITPNRAGKITIGPVKMRANYSKELGQGNNLFGPTYDQARQMVISAPTLELEVKPLPLEGRPASFTGAIGIFDFTGGTNKSQVKIGEPFDVILQIKGQGNFDRITAPPLAKPEGWRTYPPLDQFDASDALQLVGTKHFQIVVAAETPQTTSPVFEFSYFDPEKAKYFTLKTDAAALTVEGTPAPSAATPATPSAPATPAPAAPPAPELLGLRAESGFWAHAWVPNGRTTLALLVGPLPLLGIALWWRSRKDDPRLAYRQEMRQRRAALLAKVRATQDRAELFEAGGHILELDVALASARPVGTVSEEDVLAHSDRPAIRKLLQARTELVYAGSQSGSVSSQDRDLVLAAIEEFSQSRP